MAKSPQNPDSYVAQQKKEYQKPLNEIRNLIREIIPEAEEVMSYGVICYKYHYMLVGIGTKKGNCSFYTMNPDLVKRMDQDLSQIEHSGSTLYFSIKKELPIELIERVVTERIMENEARLLANAQK